MLETVTSVMSCSLCKSHCSEEPLYLCGHIVCEHCEGGDECSACKFETNGNILPLSDKIINVLYDDLVNISSVQTIDAIKTESNQVGLENVDLSTERSYTNIQTNILETVKRYEKEKSNLPEATEETMREPTIHFSENCSKPNTNCQCTDPTLIPFALPSESLTEYEPVKKIYEPETVKRINRNNSRRGIKRNLSGWRRKRSFSKDSLKDASFISDSCSEYSDENCDISNITTGHMNENILCRKFNKITAISIVDDADILGLVERYQCSNSDSLTISQKIDDTAFSEMPKLERQDIYEADNIEFTDGERDMCNLEIEHDLYKTTVSLYKSEMKDSIEDVKEITKKIVELKSKIDEFSFIGSAFNESFENTLPNNYDHFSTPVERCENEDKIIPVELQEKRPVNVTLQRTSENCYKVKSISSVYQPIFKSVNSSNLNETQTDPELINYKLEEPCSAVNFLSISSSEGYKTTSDNSSYNEHNRKLRNYAKKRKKRFYKSKSFDNLSNNCNSNTGITSFAPSLVNVHSTDVEQFYTSSDSDDLFSSQSHSYSLYNSNSCYLNKKSVKKVKRTKFKKRFTEKGIMSSNEVRQLDFHGFKEDEILSLSVKVLLFNSVVNPSSSLSFYFGGKEVIVRDRQCIKKPHGLEAELKTPKNMSIFKTVSPVQTIERIETNASFYLNRSVIDTAAGASSTPAPNPGIRSRRQLLFDTPYNQNVQEFVEIEEDSTEDYKYASIRDTEHEFDKTHYDIIRNTDKDVKNLKDNYSQTSPASIDRMASSVGSISTQPRQWGIQNQLDGLLYTTDFGVKEQVKNLCFAACGLTSSETVLVAKLAQMTQSSLSRDFSHETTHLIVGEGVSESNEYLLAIAYRANIVTIDWVILCLRDNTVLPTTGFIPGIKEGPRKCLEPVLPPFEGFYIFFKMSSSVSDYSSYELTKTLCSLGGAKVILDHEQFNPFVFEEAFPRFFIFEDKSQLTDLVLDKCKRLLVVPLSSDWVRASISAFRSQPILEFLGILANRSQLSHEYHIPMELLLSSCSNKES